MAQSVQQFLPKILCKHFCTTFIGQCQTNTCTDKYLNRWTFAQTNVIGCAAKWIFSFAQMNIWTDGTLDGQTSWDDLQKWTSSFAKSNIFTLGPLKGSTSSNALHIWSSWYPLQKWAFWDESLHRLTFLYRSIFPQLDLYIDIFICSDEYFHIWIFA